MKNLEELINNYCVSLTTFFDTNNISGLLTSPIDHFAIKAKNSQDYEFLLSKFLPLCSQAQYINLNNRRIATGQLKSLISFPKIGVASEIEILEPRPEKTNLGFAGLEHIEIINYDLDKVKQILDSKNIKYEYEDNGFHKSVNFNFDPVGLEIKFTNTPLQQVLEEEKSAGHLFSLVPSP